MSCFRNDHLNYDMIEGLMIAHVLCAPFQFRHTPDGLSHACWTR